MTIRANSLSKPHSVLPYIIILAFVFFACYIGFLVYGAMQSDVNLVSKDYYAEELAYGQRMKQVEQAQQLETPISIISAPAAGQLVIKFPNDLANAKGTVHLFRPSDVNLDVVVPLALSEDGLQYISTATLKKGLWRVQLSGEMNGKQYYQVQDITL